jgi:hypothetical protein
MTPARKLAPFSLPPKVMTEVHKECFRVWDGLEELVPMEDVLRRLDDAIASDDSYL